MNALKFLLTNKKVRSFVGGVAVTVIGTKIANATTTKELLAKGLAKGIKLKNDTIEAYENIKDEAQDIYEEAKAKAQQEELAQEQCIVAAEPVAEVGEEEVVEK